MKNKIFKDLTVIFASYFLSVSLSGCIAPAAIIAVSMVTPFLIPVQQKILSDISNLEKQSSKVVIPDEARSFDFATLKKMTLDISGAYTSDFPAGGTEVNESLLKLYQESLETQIMVHKIKVASIEDLNKAINYLKAQKPQQEINKYSIAQKAGCNSLFSGTVMFGGYQSSGFTGSSSLSQLVKSQTFKLINPQNGEILLIASLSYKQGKSITEATNDVGLVLGKAISGALKDKKKEKDTKAKEEHHVTQNF